MPRTLSMLLLAQCAVLAHAAPPVTASEDSNPAYWVAQGSAALERARGLFPGMPERARNVILFVGDGMGIMTITAARILEGQRQGKTGEEHALAFEALPFLEEPGEEPAGLEWVVDDPEDALAMVETLPRLEAVGAVDVHG